MLRHRAARDSMVHPPKVPLDRLRLEAARGHTISHRQLRRHRLPYSTHPIIRRVGLKSDASEGSLDFILLKIIIKIYNDVRG